jgi:hypothetical protein
VYKISEHLGDLFSEKRNWKVHECYNPIHEGYIPVHEGCILVHEGCILVHEGCILVHEGYISVYEFYIQERAGDLRDHIVLPATLKGSADTLLGPMLFLYRYFWPSVAKLYVSKCACYIS